MSSKSASTKKHQMVVKTQSTPKCVLHDFVMFRNHMPYPIPKRRFNTMANGDFNHFKWWIGHIQGAYGSVSKSSGPQNIWANYYNSYNYYINLNVWGILGDISLTKSASLGVTNRRFRRYKLPKAIGFEFGSLPFIFSLQPKPPEIKWRGVSQNKKIIPKHRSPNGMYAWISMGFLPKTVR